MKYLIALGIFLFLDIILWFSCSRRTKVEVVKQIGNAVPPNFAKAMFSQILSEMTA